MFVDGLSVFDPAGTSFVLAVGTTNSTNVLDLGGTGINGLAGRDLGQGGGANRPLLTTVLNGVTSGGAATVQIVLQGAPDSGAGTPGTYYTMLESPVYTLTQLQETGDENNYYFAVALPPRPPGAAPPRYLRLQYIVAVAALTGGTVESFISIGRDDQTNYVSGFTPPPASGAGT